MIFLEGLAEYKNPVDNMFQEAEKITFEELVVNMNDEQAKKYSSLKKYMSERNQNNSYIINVNSDHVILNILPQKKIVTDSELKRVQDHKFEYFEDVNYEDLLRPSFTLSEGDIFRVANEGVKPKEDYQYYVVDNGVVKAIPDYKTLEVMLSERNKNYSFVKVIEVPEFEALMKESDKGNASGNAIDTAGLDENISNTLSSGNGGGGGSIQSRSSEWSEDMKQTTPEEEFSESQSNSEEASGIMEGALEQADQTMEDVQAMIDEAAEEEESEEGD